MKELNTSWLFVCCVGLALASACSESTAPVCDSGGGGHGGGDTCDVDPWTLPEGGEIRIEQFRSSDGDNVAVQAMFWENQTPAARPLGGVPLEGNCEDYTAGNLFDNGFYDIQQTIADSRTYQDQGPSLMLRTGTTDFVLSRTMNAADRSAGIMQDIIYLGTDNASELVYGANYNVVGLDFNRAVDINSVDTTPGEFFLGPNFTTSANLLTTTPELPASGDYTVSWTPSPGTRAAFLTFVDSTTFGGEYGCFDIPNTGSITVPESVISQVDDAGLMLIIEVDHRPHDFDGRRLDVLGINCNIGAYTKAPAI